MEQVQVAERPAGRGAHEMDVRYVSGRVLCGIGAGAPGMVGPACGIRRPGYCAHAH